MYLIDTDIAVHLRDGDLEVRARVAEMAVTPSLSVISRVELEGGAHAQPRSFERRRRALDSLLAILPVINFTETEADMYRRIVSATGFSRRKIRDRMIAATAMAHDLTLVTMNGDDFRDIPGLTLEVWESPARA
jgi:tRNA(fMet)-specific endonuclease VapC